MELCRGPPLHPGYVQPVDKISDNGGARLVREQLLPPGPIGRGLRARRRIIGEHDHEIARGGSTGGVTPDTSISDTGTILGNRSAGQNDVVRSGAFAFDAFYGNT